MCVISDARPVVPPASGAVLNDDGSNSSARRTTRDWRRRSAVSDMSSACTWSLFVCTLMCGFVLKERQKSAELRKLLGLEPVSLVTLGHPHWDLLRPTGWIKKWDHIVPLLSLPTFLMYWNRGDCNMLWLCTQTWGNPGEEFPRWTSIAVHRRNRYSTELSAGKEAWTCDEVYHLRCGLSAALIYLFIWYTMMV